MEEQPVVTIKYKADVEDVKAKLNEIILLLEKMKTLTSGLGLKIEVISQHLTPPEE